MLTAVSTDLEPAAACSQTSARYLPSYLWCHAILVDNKGVSRSWGKRKPAVRCACYRKSRLASRVLYLHDSKTHARKYTYVRTWLLTDVHGPDSQAVSSLHSLLPQWGASSCSPRCRCHHNAGPTCGSSDGGQARRPSNTPGAGAALLFLE